MDAPGPAWILNNVNYDDDHDDDDDYKNNINTNNNFLFHQILLSIWYDTYDTWNQNNNNNPLQGINLFRELHWMGEMKEGSGHHPSYAESEKKKSLVLHTNGCLTCQLFFFLATTIMYLIKTNPKNVIKTNLKILRSHGSRATFIYLMETAQSLTC